MTTQRYANIDGLRAIAALGVMVEHMFGDLLRQTPPAAGPLNVAGDLLVQNVSLGRFGVALFFLISGFVVPFSIGGERPLFQFAVSRVFRLYPALWLALAVLATMAWLGGEPPRAITVLANMTMAPTLFGQPWLSPIYWTLFIELVFYILIALLFSAGALRRVAVLSLLSLALVVAQVVAVPSVAAFSLARGDNFIMEGLTPVLTAYALAFVIFMAAVRFDRPRSLLLSRIGLISYSMYLFHWPVNITVYRVLPLTGQIGDIATMLICSGLVLLVSWLVYRLVERPMIMFGRAIVLRHGVASRP